MPELAAVLIAVGASDQQREQALLLLQAPRSLRCLRHEGATGVGEEIPLPSAGDLLRALRRRRGLTQEQVSARLGISQSTIARWERSETLLATDRQADLLSLLGAHPEEARALIQGQHLSLFPDRSFPNRLSLEEQVEATNALCRQVMYHPEDPLLELRFLSLQAQLWSAARRSAPSRYLCAVAAVNQAWASGQQGRYPEATRQTERALAILQREFPPTYHWLQARVMHARYAAAVQPESARYLTQGLRQLIEIPGVLRTVLASVVPFRGHRGAAAALLYNSLAEMESLAGNHDAAVTLAREALREARGIEFLNTRRFCHVILAECLTLAGRPREALGVLDSSPEWRDHRQYRRHEPAGNPATPALSGVGGAGAPPCTVCTELLVRSQTLAALDDRSEASRYLSGVCTLLETHDIPARHRWAKVLVDWLDSPRLGNASVPPPNAIAEGMIDLS